MKSKLTTYNNGTKEWLLNGKRHREDGPAIIEINGRKEWYINGERHREDGPAVVRSDGGKLWHLNDIYYTEEQYKVKIRSRKLTKLLK